MEAAPADFAMRPPDRLRELNPRQLSELDQMSLVAWQHVDPSLLEIVRLRIAGLLGHPRAGQRSSWVSADQVTDEQIAALADWPTAPVFDERDRDCIAFTEQFVIDVGGLSDEQAAAAQRHFDPGTFYAFVNAVWVMDLGQRLEMVSAPLFEPVA